MKDKNIQQAWREKVTLVWIIIILCASVGFISFGLQPLLCSGASRTYKASNAVDGTAAPFNSIIVHGSIVDVTSFEHRVVSPITEPEVGNLLTYGDTGLGLNRKDVSFMFQKVKNCQKLLSINDATLFPCNLDGDPNSSDKIDDACHSSQTSRDTLKKFRRLGDIFYDWTDVTRKKRLLVHNK
jgi:chitin synthase